MLKKARDSQADVGSTPTGKKTGWEFRLLPYRRDSYTTNMSSLVHDLQNDIRRSGKSVTEILRTAKLISAKLGLTDISEWLDAELNGYKSGQTIPAYRLISSGNFQIHNPARGWQGLGSYDGPPIPSGQAVTELVKLAEEKQAVMRSPHHIEVEALGGMDYMVNQFDQRVIISGSQIAGIIEAVKNKVLEWTIELEQRRILGENMSFDAREKHSAQSQTFHIQNATGVFGNVTNSQVTIYDYSSIHQTLKQAGVPQEARNEIENIMDLLKTAKPDEKKSLVERGKNWIVKNQQLLGASASIVRRALGFE